MRDNLLDSVNPSFLKLMQLCKLICAGRASECCFERYELVQATTKAFVT